MKKKNVINRKHKINMITKMTEFKRFQFYLMTDEAIEMVRFLCMAYGRNEKKIQTVFENRTGYKLKIRGETLWD